MAWREVSMIDERKKFILEVINPHRNSSFIALCEQYNISSKTGYKWLARFYENGENGLSDKSRAPRTNINKITADVEEAIVYIRRLYPSWGPKKILAELKNNFGHLKFPSEGSIATILKNNNLSNQRIYRRHVAKTSPLKDCYEPNDVWSYDFKGWFLVASGEKCEPLTITDGFF